MLALEIGNEQFKKVSKILIDKTILKLNIIKDYKNNIRCVLSTYK
jgi:methylase of polypeptide subunit release factors